MQNEPANKGKIVGAGEGNRTHSTHIFNFHQNWPGTAVLLTIVEVAKIRHHESTRTNPKKVVSICQQRQSAFSHRPRQDPSATLRALGDQARRSCQRGTYEIRDGNGHDKSSQKTNGSPPSHLRPTLLPWRTHNTSTPLRSLRSGFWPSQNGFPVSVRIPHKA